MHVLSVIVLTWLGQDDVSVVSLAYEYKLYEYPLCVI
jgi:hypothetical protein